MTTQPETLRLAEFYEALAEEPPKSPDNSDIRATAAKLRRLAAVEAQRDALLKALKNVMYWDNGKPEWEDARAAIKAVEENT